MAGSSSPAVTKEQQQKHRSVLYTAGTTLLLFLIAAADYFTTRNVQCGVFYYIPITLAAWRVGRWAGMSTALASAALSYAVDVINSTSDSSPIYTASNAVLRLISFVWVAYLLTNFRGAHQRQKVLNEQLSGAVADLQKSNEEVRRLQNEVQTVCAWTHKIRSEGKWMDFEEFMQRRFNIRFSHGISEEALRDLETEPGSDGNKPDEERA